MPADSVVFGHIKSESEQILFDVANKIFTAKDYNQTSAATWISQANEEAVRALLSNNKNFKYIVLTTVMQKSEGVSPLEMSACCSWNSSTDGQAAIMWESESMYVLMSMYALAL